MKESLLPIGKRLNVVTTSPTGSLSLASPDTAGLGKLKRWADYTPAAQLSSPTPGALIPRTPAAQFAPTPTPYGDTYEPGFGFSMPSCSAPTSSIGPTSLIGTSSSISPGTSSSIAAPAMSNSFSQSGVYQPVQSGMVMTSGTMQPMAPYQTTAMAPISQPEGMQMMWVPMQSGMAQPMQNGMAQPGMMIAPGPSPAMVINSATSASPSQMPVAQEPSMGMQNQQAQMIMIGVVPAQPMAQQPQAPQPQVKMSVADAGRQVFGEALNPETFEAEERQRDVVVKEAVVLSSGQLPSPGSALHGTGTCNPCAWFWKPKGCMNDKTCSYCHLCPEGELKQRKKAKVTAMRMGALEPSTTSGPPAIKLTQLLGDDC